MRITRIESQKSNPTRKNIYIDGEFALGISAETLLLYGLRTGDEVTESLLKQLSAAEGLHAARRAAMQLLARRPRSEKEIRDRLREKEFSEEEIQQTLDALRSAGLVSDEAFARTFIREQLSLHAKGPLAIKEKLLVLGINKQTIDRALSEVLQDVSEAGVARNAAERFLRSTGRKHSDPHTKRRKLTAFLAGRGFSWDVIAEVVARSVGPPENGETM